MQQLQTAADTVVEVSDGDTVGSLVVNLHLSRNLAAQGQPGVNNNSKKATSHKGGKSPSSVNGRKDQAVSQMVHGSSFLLFHALHSGM